MLNSANNPKKVKVILTAVLFLFPTDLMEIVNKLEGYQVGY